VEKEIAMLENEENPYHEDIILALKDAGYQAHESTAPDGSKAVILPILDARYDPVIIAAQDPELRAYFKQAGIKWAADTYLHIVIRGSKTMSEVGVVGRRGESGQAVESQDWQQVSDLPGLIRVVNALWAGRDALLNKYIAARSG
jgi:hypothetical protein